MCAESVIPGKKAAEAARLRTAAEAVVAELRTYATEHGGRFFVFGSAATGTMSFVSDFDVMVESATAEAEQAAMRFVEERCRHHDIDPDIHAASACKPAFVARIKRHAVVAG